MPRFLHLLLAPAWMGCTENQLTETVQDTDTDSNSETDSVPECEEPLVGYLDNDGDGFGNVLVEDCTLPPEAVEQDGDCDDDDATVHPGAEDVCDGVDNDCDTDIDEDAEVLSGWVDGDGDGHGDASQPIEGCDIGSAASVADDCDDSDSTVSPSAEEICGNGVDDDCDGSAAGCLPSGAMSLESEGILVAAASGSDYASRDFASGDVNGDGVSDLWVGATGRGRAFLMLGPITADTTLAAADAQLENGTQTGIGMAMGDLDGDGLDDLLVGDIWDGEYDVYAGSAWWLSGPISGAVSLDDVAAGKISATEYRQNLGAELLAVPDMDGNGTAELIITAVGEDDYAGAVYVFDGAPSGEVGLESADGVLRGDAAGASFGEALAWGDLDGDGLPELIVGGGGAKGRVGVFSGGLSGEWGLADADANVVGADEIKLGYSVASGMDLNGDGHDDLAAGAPEDHSGVYYGGVVYVFTGPLSGSLSLKDAAATHLSATLYEEAGTAVALVPDLDGNGSDELLVGAPYYTDDEAHQGRAYLVTSPAADTTLGTDDAAWKGRGSVEYAGYTLASSGDVTGDGQLDLLIGAVQEDTSGNDAGGVYLVPVGGF